MTTRLVKLSEYLKTQNFEMAVEEHLKNKDVQLCQDEVIALAKAYYLQTDYLQSIDLLKSQQWESLKNEYEATLLLFKCLYLTSKLELHLLHSLQAKLGKSQSNQMHSAHLRQIDEICELFTFNRQHQKSELQLKEQYNQFIRICKIEDAELIQGFPMFILPLEWYQNWCDYTTSSDNAFKKGVCNPGPITQFQLLDHFYYQFYYRDSNKAYANKYLFNTRYKVLGRKSWLFLKNRYGGIDIKRYNISTLERPYQIITEVYLKRVTIAISRQAENYDYLFVQITRKQTFKGLKSRITEVWGPGEIYQYADGVQKTVKNVGLLEDFDNVDKIYLFVSNNRIEDLTKSITRSDSRISVNEKCGYSKCEINAELKYCQCKLIKYCSMECLKKDRKNHQKTCESELLFLNKKSSIFKNFNLKEKQFGGRQGVVGLKNLGNTCYMNSGLQCLSNTQELTEYFMKDEFMEHLNFSNQFGSKGTIACSYAELIRQMWTGSSASVSPFTLKKMIGKFANQFSGYGQQDSQQFISQLIDRLQEDLNLVKIKQNFESQTDFKSDEEGSKQSQYNYSLRIQSYIRELMSGQFKSTVICSKCQRASVCFDPFMLIPLPLPSSQQSLLFYVSPDLSRGAIKFQFQFNASTTFEIIARDLSLKFVDKKSAKSFIFVLIDISSCKIIKVINNNEVVLEYAKRQHIFCFQLPATHQKQEIMLVEYRFNNRQISFPRLIKVNKLSHQEEQKRILIRSVLRISDKNKLLPSFDQIVSQVDQGFDELLTYKKIVLSLKKQYTLLTYTDSQKQGIRGKLNEMPQTMASLQDCLRAFTLKQRLEKENSWYCNRCKEFNEAEKQMEIYKANKILVLALKRFTRVRKIRTPVNFPLEHFDLGPFLLSNKQNKPINYDLYGVINHYGSLGGGHYTAFCRNFINKKWYEFNDTLVKQISPNSVMSNDSYVLFYRRRD